MFVFLMGGQHFVENYKITINESTQIRILISCSISDSVKNLFYLIVTMSFVFTLNIAIY